MIKYAFIPFLFLSFFSSPIYSAPSETLVYDMLNKETLPARFRKSNDPIKDPEINVTGLNTLQSSGSGQFSELSLVAIRQRLNNPKNLIIIDLRDESHGFINGAAVTWYADRDWGNKGLTAEQAAAEELKRIASIPIGTNVTIYSILEKSDQGAIFKSSPSEVKVLSIKDEATLTKEQNIGYLRLRVLDHTAPLESEVKAFIEYVNKLPPDAWIHVHCRGGSGRTTTFLCIYDILKNGKKVPFKDILRRQFILGGGDIAGSAESETWKGPFAQERLVFLQNFYNRVVDGKS